MSGLKFESVRKNFASFGYAFCQSGVSSYYVVFGNSKVLFGSLKQAKFWLQDQRLQAKERLNSRH